MRAWPSDVPETSLDSLDLDWHFNSAAGAMGFRSGYGAMVAALEGMLDTGYHSYEISEHALAAATKDRRISRALSLITPAAQSTLRRYFTGACPLHPLAALTRAAREAYWRVPGTAPTPGMPTASAAPRAKAVSILRKRLKPKKPKPEFGEWLSRLAQRLRVQPSSVDRSLALRITTEADSLLNAALQEYRGQVRRRG